MTNPEKIVILSKLHRRIDNMLKELDFGDQTEYIDRALDQVNYALEECKETEAEFQEGV